MRHWGHSSSLPPSHSMVLPHEEARQGSLSLFKPIRKLGVVAYPQEKGDSHIPTICSLSKQE